MKKILALTVASFIAVVSNAAAVGWTLAGASDYKNGTAYVYVSSDSSKLTSLIGDWFGDKKITSAEIASFATADLLFGSTSVTATGAANRASSTSGLSITYSGEGTDTYYGVAVLVDSTSGKVSYTSTASIALSNNTTNKTFGFANQSANLASNAVNVPEPTGGFLLLLGVTVLALKRKKS